MILKGYKARMYVNRGTESNPILVEVGGDTPVIESTEQALLNTIRANPDDEAPRLVYADWLDEHDQPERAWAIRESPVLRWQRLRYGRWVWEREYHYKDASLLGGKAYWAPLNIKQDGHGLRAKKPMLTLFPETWRRNLNTVIYRRGFVAELGVDRFHSNVMRLLETQPVTTVITTAEALLSSLSCLSDYPDECPSLRTVRLTTIPASCQASKGQSKYHLSFAGVDHIVTIPNNGALIYTQGPVSDSTNICYRLGRVFGHYLTPHGITVQLPDLQ